jgi:hypothetical protein
MVAPTVVSFVPTFELQLRLQFDDICVGQYVLTLLDHTSGTPSQPAGSRLQHGWVHHLRGHARRLVQLSSALTETERDWLLLRFAFTRFRVLSLPTLPDLVPITSYFFPEIFRSCARSPALLSPSGPYSRCVYLAPRSNMPYEPLRPPSDIFILSLPKFWSLCPVRHQFNSFFTGILYIVFAATLAILHDSRTVCCPTLILLLKL